MQVKIRKIVESFENTRKEGGDRVVVKIKIFELVEI